MEEIDLKFSKYLDVQFGGHWKPKDCKPRWKVGLWTCRTVDMSVILLLFLSLLSIKKLNCSHISIHLSLFYYIRSVSYASSEFKTHELIHAVVMSDCPRSDCPRSLCR